MQPLDPLGLNAEANFASNAQALIKFQGRSYKLFQCHSMNKDPLFQKLRFRELHMAVPRFGGPIAALRRRSKLY